LTSAASRKSEPALDVRGLAKTYTTGLFRKKRYAALKALDLTVERGEILGYLGPNGSGKTTTLKILMGLVFPDAGDGSVLGFPLRDRGWRQRAGYLPEQPYFYDYLSAREYLDYAGRLFGIPARERRDRAARLLEMVGLRRSAGVSLRRFSKGMMQRLGIAQALINDPELVVLDEPMSGLDPIGRRLVRDIILALKGEGKTVLFSTHILSDAEALCDRVALLRGGELLRVGDLAGILGSDVSHMEILVAGLSAEAVQQLAPALKASRALGDRWRLEASEASLGPIVSDVEKAGGRVLSIQPVRQSLEDYFLKEMGTVRTGAEWELEG
jgi:ABC-2 type transport system ATP-binding protein